MDQILLEKLKACLQKPLPGPEAQFRMAHVARRQNAEAPAGARQAAVMCLLYEKNGEPHVALIERTSADPRDRHAGQIAFPGGKVDAADASFEAAAKRETEEEIGVSKEKIMVLGRLTALYIPVSGFSVHPFVGAVEGEPSFRLQTDEVSALLETPLSLLRDTETVKRGALQVAPGFRLDDVPHFELFGKICWGATAMMLNEFLVAIEPAFDR